MPFGPFLTREQILAVVAVATLDEGLAAGPPVAEVPLCAEHLGDVAEACGFERPGDLRGEGSSR